MNATTALPQFASRQTAQKSSSLLAELVANLPIVIIARALLKR